MELPPDLELIHQPTRLRIMGVLYKHGDVAYTRLRDHLELTDGNLATHVDSLANADYVTERRAWAQNGFETRYRITRSGVSAFETYLDELQGFLTEHGDEGAG